MIGIELKRLFQQNQDHSTCGHYQANGMRRSLPKGLIRMRRLLSGEQIPCLTNTTINIISPNTPLILTTFQKISEQRFHTLTQGFDQIKEPQKLETLIRQLLKNLGWNKSKERLANIMPTMISNIVPNTSQNSKMKKRDKLCTRWPETIGRIVRRETGHTSKTFTARIQFEHNKKMNIYYNSTNYLE